mmetsp:Transcript_16519/g.42856  ORF Transcript_16519/g.42856 Transcript_16519/m.42856 type:complete len:309 (-) Transcript_16519:343-1269(-)
MSRARPLRATFHATPTLQSRRPLHAMWRATPTIRVLRQSRSPTDGVRRTRPSPHRCGRRWKSQRTRTPRPQGPPAARWRWCGAWPGRTSTRGWTTKSRRPRLRHRRGRCRGDPPAGHYLPRTGSRMSRGASCSQRRRTSRPVELGGAAALRELAWQLAGKKTRRRGEWGDLVVRRNRRAVGTAAPPRWRSRCMPAVPRRARGQLHSPQARTKVPTSQTRRIARATYAVWLAPRAPRRRCPNSRCPRNQLPLRIDARRRHLPGRQARLSARSWSPSQSTTTHSHLSSRAARIDTAAYRENTDPRPQCRA